MAVARGDPEHPRFSEVLVPIPIFPTEAELQEPDILTLPEGLPTRAMPVDSGPARGSPAASALLSPFWGISPSLAELKASCHFP